MNTQQVREIRKVNKHSSVNNSKNPEEKKRINRRVRDARMLCMYGILRNNHLYFRMFPIFYTGSITVNP